MLTFPTPYRVFFMYGLKVSYENISPCWCELVWSGSLSSLVTSHSQLSPQTKSDLVTLVAAHTTKLVDLQQHHLSEMFKVNNKMQK